MTADERKLLEAEIAAGINTASSYVSLIGPQGAAFALVGKAVAALEPTIVESVLAIFQKTAGAPTEEEERKLANDVEALMTPENL